MNLGLERAPNQQTLDKNHNYHGFGNSQNEDSLDEHFEEGINGDGIDEDEDDEDYEDEEEEYFQETDENYIG